MQEYEMYSAQFPILHTSHIMGYNKMIEKNNGYIHTLSVILMRLLPDPKHIQEALGINIYNWWLHFDINENNSSYYQTRLWIADWVMITCAD